MCDVDFQTLYGRHNGDLYLTPTDLEISRVRPRRVLIVGSCLAEVWQSKIDCPCDFVMTNNLNELPTQPPHPISEYDLQLVQLPLRSLLPDDAFWHISFLDMEAFRQVFDAAVQRMRANLDMAMRWNRENGILTFVANFFVPQQNAMGRLAPRCDLRNPVYFIEKLNEKLAQEIECFKNSYLLDIDAISSVLGRRYIQDDTAELQTHASLLGDSNYAYDQDRIEPIASMTHHYKLHHNSFLATLWHQAAAMYKTIRQADTVKLVIVDLDQTLWRGVVAENSEVTDQTIEGWPLGLVEALSYLKKRGILLAICSKNDQERIKPLWDKIMHGRLRLEDFAAVNINWKTKAENIEEILRRTSLLPRSAIFIDDNPAERASVQAAFPEIRTLGRHPYYLKRILLWAPETQVPVVTQESARRTEMINAQAEREEARKKMSREDFLASLNLEIDVAPINNLDHPSFARVLELLNKTNQFNTNGRRWTREECENAIKGGWDLVAFTMRDRLANYGLTACTWINQNKIEQFVMSCRVIGLDAENMIIEWLEQIMQQAGKDSIIARIIETTSNFPCRDMFARCGFTLVGGDWVKRW